MYYWDRAINCWPKRASINRPGKLTINGFTMNRGEGVTSAREREREKHLNVMWPAGKKMSNTEVISNKSYIYVGSWQLHNFSLDFALIMLFSSLYSGIEEWWILTPVSSAFEYIAMLVLPGTCTSLVLPNNTFYQPNEGMDFQIA